jgi:hypothetical protein
MMSREMDKYEDWIGRTDIVDKRRTNEDVKQTCDKKVKKWLSIGDP